MVYFHYHIKLKKGGWISVAPQQQRRKSTAPDWQAIASSEEFKKLMARKKRFLVIATIFFIVYYFSLPIAAGYFQDILNVKVMGSVNLAYLFALSQFFMAWILAIIYVRHANKTDQIIEEIKKKY